MAPGCISKNKLALGHLYVGHPCYRGRLRRRWLDEVVETYGRHKKQPEIVVDGEDLS